MREIWTFWKRMNSPCEDIARLISASMDRVLTRGERIVVRSHVLYCVACRRFRSQVRFLKDAMIRLRDRVDRCEIDDADPSLTLPPDARARILGAWKDRT
jgi:predicted anti-sigma-YlaC factor YlaD